MTLQEKLLAVQTEIGAIKKDSKNPYFKSNYFDINALLGAVKPVLNGHKLVLLQALTTIELTGKIALETKILDSENDTQISSICPLPSLEDPQKMGGVITYFRRYALQTLLALEAEDDDGNYASGRTTKPVAKKELPADDDPPF